MQILLVEDDRYNLTLVRQLIEAYHVPPLAVHAALTVEEAKQLLLNEGPFGLTLVDWELPDASGVVFIRWLRSMPSLQTLPVIMLTGRGTAEDVLEAMEAGANDYLVKPVQREILLDKLQKYTRARGRIGSMPVPCR